MKKYLLGGALLLAGSLPVYAADLGVKAPIYKAPAPFSWSGIYGGVSGGYGWGSNDVLYGSNVTLFSQHYKPTGGFGGIQLGYNEQIAPHWLLGTEFDVSFGDISDTVTVIGGGNTTPTKDKFDWFGTARTRFGYVQDKALIYGTFGAIWLHEKYAAPLTSPGLGGNALQENFSQYHVSWVWGGGVEYAFDPRWSFKLEYLYAQFDGTHDVYSGTRSSSDPTFQVVRAGLNYRFADGSVSVPAFPVKAAPLRSNWSGSYIGVHGGYAWGKTSSDLFYMGPPTVAYSSADIEGGFGGFQGGYNWVFAPQWLAGIETDASYGDLKGNGLFGATVGGAPCCGAAVSAKVEGLGTARLRLGYLATPDVLVYGTGGAAYARAKVTDTGPEASEFDHLGWVAGGGVEWKFAPDWSTKIEYSYADLGTVTFDGPSGAFAGGPIVTNRSYDLTLQTIKVGLNYSGPVIERFFGAR